MAGKISQYPSSITTLESGDLFDVSEFLNPGYESKSLDWDDLLTNLNSQLTFANIYTTDGTTTGQRTIGIGTNDLVFGSTGDTNLLRFDATSDRIGIGIAAPTEKLQVNGNTYTTGQGSFGTGINPNSHLQVTASGKIVGIAGISNAITTNNGAAIRGTANSTSAIEVYGVDGSAAGTNATGGRTGVRGNAITTGSRNHVGGKFVGNNGTNQNIGVRGTTGNGTTGTIIRGVLGESLYQGASDAYGGYFSSQGAGTTNIGLYATANTATNNYAAIFDNGNVGIGTSTPTQKLEIVGGVRVDASITNALFVFIL